MQMSVIQGIDFQNFVLDEGLNLRDTVKINHYVGIASRHTPGIDYPGELL